LNVERWLPARLADTFCTSTASAKERAFFSREPFIVSPETPMALFRTLALVAALFPSHVLAAVLRSPPALRATGKANVTAAPVHHGLVAVNSTTKGGPPCACIAEQPTWVKCTRTVPRCVFIDLGAADGNSFNEFLSNKYGEVGKCPSVQWSAVLVEANPRFDQPLAQVGGAHLNQVTVMSSTAAYMCEAQTSFYLDTVNTGANYWGSSMSSSHPDVQKSGQQKVTVPTMNLNKILYEQTIPGDWVMVKMDIEGSEYDVLPCLAKAPAASLIDRLYMEQHDASWGNTGTTPAQMEAAKAELRRRGVDIPAYFSHTL